ncbi:hypothetical protein SUGI_0683850 [Cryptomeria japonica]|nr:hypothetical protein SUGI_0683850 [Cryptomeria japonica]
MGREIASRHSSNRLWQPQINDIKKHFKKEMPIRGIQPPATFVAYKEYTQLMGISSRLSNGLEILHVEGNDFTENFASLSEHLVWLRWEGFPLKKIPVWLTLRHLSVLEIHGAHELEELWEDNVDPPEQLRELIIEWSGYLQRLPSSIGRLHYLSFFAPNLSSLPDGFGNLKSLKSLDLGRCEQLSELPGSFTQLIHLENLNLSFCAKLKLKLDVLENIKKLAFLGLRGCEEIEDLPHQIVNQVPGIQSLERVERLDELVLECDTISAVKPCIQSMKECPRYLRIQGSVSRFAEPAVNEVDKTSGQWKKGDYLFYLEGKEENEEERKVVRICVCLDGITRYMSISGLRGRGSVEVERERAVVVEGRRERVVEAFYRLLARLE